MTEIHSRISESGIGGAFTMAIIAFTVVFLVLGGLSAIIYGIKFLAAGIANKKITLPPGGKTPSAVSPPAQALVSAPAPAPSPSSPDRGRLLAVLAAAVAASSGKRAVIRSVTPLFSSPRGGGEWKRMGIIEGHSALSRDWK